MYELIPEIFITAERKNRCLRENTFLVRKLFYHFSITKVQN